MRLIRGLVAVRRLHKQPAGFQSLVAGAQRAKIIKIDTTVKAHLSSSLLYGIVELLAKDLSNKRCTDLAR